MTQQTCAGCEYFVPHEEFRYVLPTDVDPLPIRIKLVHPNQCRRYPPNASGNYARPSSTDWCGEFDSGDGRIRGLNEGGEQ